MPLCSWSLYPGSAAILAAPEQARRLLSQEKPCKNFGTIQIPVDSSEETPGGGRMVI